MTLLTMGSRVFACSPRATTTRFADFAPERSRISLIADPAIQCDVYEYPQRLRLTSARA